MNTWGTLFKVTLYGESHQPSIGVVVEGIPYGLTIDEERMRQALKKRNPDLIGTTSRKEADRFTIDSGIYEGKTTGSPIHMSIPNENIQSSDYQHLKNQPRPGHADYVASIKYGQLNDPRGGGRFSGRLTAPLVMAGTLAQMMLPYTFSHRLVQVGSLVDMSQIDTYLQSIKDQGDSVGGIIEITVTGIPVGLGEPMFGKVESLIGQLLFSIPAVKGVSFGTGFEGIQLLGSQFNDRIIDERGTTDTNHSGGISGGITNGNPLVIRVFIKPTSSIQKVQETFNKEADAVTSLLIGGRHDVCIARRAGIVCESMVAIALADLYLLDRQYGRG
jgi:chorismate synthase